MTTEHTDLAWQAPSYAEKNKLLYERQKKMLEAFLERGAISKAQYEKSLHDMTEKMGIIRDCEYMNMERLKSHFTEKAQ